MDCIFSAPNWASYKLHHSNAQFFNERFELPRETSKLEKSGGLVHCSVENAAV